MIVLSTQNKIVAIAVMLLLAIGAFFMTNVVIPAEAHFVSEINVILFAVPAFWAAKMWLGIRDSIILFLILGILALVIETLAIVSGFPYGHFGYSDLLGYRLLGYTPWAVALAWTPLVLAAYAVAGRLARGNRWLAIRVVLGAVILLAFDLVIDPGAVRIGFWRYEGGGVFYGVPLSNFAGWLFSGAIGAIVIEMFTALRKPLLPVPAQLVSSSFFIIFFWTAIAFFSGMYVPMLIGIAVLFSLAIFYAKNHYAFDDMIVIVDDEDRPIGTALKLPAHDANTKLHRAFSVFLFNGKGELLLQQRALTKKTWPGVWSNSCCGHVMLHETIEQAAKRRLKYELGISGVTLNVVLSNFRYRAEKDGIVENEICPVLVAFCSQQPHPNPYEVYKTRWVDWNAFIHDIHDPANGFSPWSVEEVELLTKEPRFEQFRKSLNENVANRSVITP